MTNLENNEIEQIAAGVIGLGPYVDPAFPKYEDPNLIIFIEWKMMNPGYPYDQI